MVLAIEDDQQGILFRISPNLQEWVQESDLQYIDQLLRDFCERARQHPNALFKHLSSLSVGPLVTHKVGNMDTDSEYLTTYCSNFSDL